MTWPLKPFKRRATAFAPTRRHHDQITVRDLERHVSDQHNRICGPAIFIDQAKRPRKIT